MKLPLTLLGCGIVAGLILTTSLLSTAAAEPANRQMLSLDGAWEIAEGPMAACPGRFDHKVVVPGLIDMAQPAFAEVGVASKRREAFWYRRTFHIDGPVPAVATLKVHKAMFGARAILNGTPLGDHLPSFTPGLFDAHQALRTGQNELVIRVGAFRDAVPKYVPSGWDYEKYRFTPGIFDSVELILTGDPHILRVQAVPDLDKQAVTVHAWVEGSAQGAAGLKFTVREASSGRIVGQSECTTAPAAGGSERTGQATIPLRGCHPWSPEDPFLYELQARSDGDVLTTRFGMRTFRLDPATGRAILNGRPYFMRGSNVTLYRFFEDSQRGDKPWREEWVRRLHRAFRDMHWNSLRYCIGFPPEAWYRIADEEGFLIQDEFPIWNMDPKPGDFDARELAAEYTEWMQERWNHPCVVVWDGCNETRSPVTGKAIQHVRGLDYSNRPWDNGWSPPVAPGDSNEQHPYHFINPSYKLANIAGDPGTLGWQPGKNAIIVNEYGWLWLNRDGTPTTLTKDLYRNLLGPNSTTAARRHLYARYLAAETEFWRSHRAFAAVMHFCALGYSRPGEQPRPEGGATSDHWTDVERLAWDPEFADYVRDAFAPVGLMIDAWAEEYPPGKTQDFPVVVINDLYQGWKGTVRFRLLGDGKTLQEKSQPAEVPALGKLKLVFSVKIPAHTGPYQVEAALVSPAAKPVRSLRDFSVMSDAQRRARQGLAVGRPVLASSSIAQDGATSAAAAVDGNPATRWSSEFSDPQWIAVDLGQTERVSRVVLQWEAACAKVYTLDVSPDGKTWKTVYENRSGRGGTEEIRFAPVEARWVRMTGTRRATNFGYSLWELGVFNE
jgi:hypothetical protein